MYKPKHSYMAFSALVLVDMVRDTKEIEKKNKQHTWLFNKMFLPLHH